MTPILLSITALTIFLIWGIVHEGLLPSISEFFYRAKTRWAYTMVIGGIGVLMTFAVPGTLIHYAGASLALGTLAPHFKDKSSLSTPLHFGFTVITAVLAETYVYNLWVGFGALVLLGLAKLLEKHIKNAVFWVEILLFYSVFIGIIIKLIS